MVVGADIIRPVKIGRIFTNCDVYAHFALQNGRADDIRPYGIHTTYYIN